MIPSCPTRPSWLTRVIPWLAAGLATTLVVAAFYPGYMSPDSIDQLSQARAGIYSDWHPPAMAWLWRQMDKIWTGPAGMLLLQVLFFFGALALILTAVFSPLPAAALVLGVGMVPSVFGLLSTIWKDVQHGVAALMAFALLLRFSLTRRWGYLAASAVPLFWAAAVRQNGAAAVAPLTAWVGWLLRDALPFRTPRVARWLGGSLGFLVAGALFLLAFSWNSFMTSRSLHAEQALYLHDLTALSIARGENLLPEYLRSDPSVATLGELRQIFRHDSAAPLLWDSRRRLRFSEDPKDLESLRQEWLRAILKNPGAYLRHRVELARHLFAVGTENPETVATGIGPNDLGVTMHRTSLNRLTVRVLEATAPSVLFSGWLYVTVICAALLIARARKIPSEGCAPVAALAASGLCYAAPYVLLAPAAGFRYLWWTAVAALVSLLLAFAPRRETTAD